MIYLASLKHFQILKDYLLQWKLMVNNKNRLEEWYSSPNYFIMMIKSRI